MNHDNPNTLPEKGDDDSTLYPVPEGYFESLPDAIMARIEGEEEKEKKKEVEVEVEKREEEEGRGRNKRSTKIIRLVTYVSSIAAVLLIAFGISMYFSDKNENQLSSVTAQDIIESGVLYEFDEHLLAEQIQLDEEDATVSNENKEIEEYLIDQNSDISTLINDY